MIISAATMGLDPTGLYWKMLTCSICIVLIAAASAGHQHDQRHHQSTNHKETTLPTTNLLRKEQLNTNYLNHRQRSSQQHRTVRENTSSYATQKPGKSSPSVMMTGATTPSKGTLPRSFYPQKMVGELLISLPLSIIMPTLRSEKSPSSHFRKLTHHAQNKVDRVINYVFDQLEVTDTCQPRFICEIIQNPKDFNFLTSIFYLTLRSGRNLGRYRQGLEVGLNKGRCQDVGRCRKTPYDFINMDTLKYWQKISQKLPLTLTV